MSSRLQILVPAALDARIKKAARRQRLSVGAWVRQAIERALANPQAEPDPLVALSRLGAPTGDIDQMLAEIEAGRG